MDNRCIFCRIIAGELPCDKALETEDCLVIRDIAPAAPVHLLCMPKSHVPHVAAAGEQPALLGTVMAAATRAAREAGLEADGYRLIINHGADAGQTVEHLHVHILGGKPLGEKLV